MRFVVAPDSFKGSLTAVEVGRVIEKALLREMPDADVDVIPMADGGEGTVESFLFAEEGQRIDLSATGPTGERIPTFYGLLHDGETAVIEVAAVAGLTLVPEGKRNPLYLTTYGVGECLLHALDQGVKRIVVGLGGSATNDGGLGMLQALGVTFRDGDGKRVEPFAASLSRVQFVDYGTIDPRIKEVDVRVACDVDNPLCGPRGATHVFGPQKGLRPNQLERVDADLASYAERVEAHVNQAFQHHPGAGAAGGLGFAMLSIGASLESGAALVAETVGMKERLRSADWLVTGEGKTDSQTLHGKVPYYLAKLAKECGTPTILMSGSLAGDVEPLYDVFASMHAIPRGPMTLEEALGQAEALIYDKARNIARLLNVQHKR